MILLIALGALILTGVGLVLTWYHADAYPVFGPAQPDRVTFKRVLQNFLCDVIEIFSPLLDLGRRFWIWAGPKLANSSTWSAILINAALFWPYFFDNEAGRALLNEYPWLHFIGAIAGLIASRPASAPYRVPAGGRSPTGGLVNNQAIA